MFDDTGFGVAYRCDCINGFRGRLCEININECISLPCKNGGVCKVIMKQYCLVQEFGTIPNICPVESITIDNQTS